MAFISNITNTLKIVNKTSEMGMIDTSSACYFRNGDKAINYFVFHSMNLVHTVMPTYMITYKPLAESQYLYSDRFVMINEQISAYFRY